MEYGIYNEQLRKSAARKWMKLEQGMRNAMERTLLMSQDQGVVTPETVDFLANSGTSYTALSLGVTLRTGYLVKCLSF